MEEKGFMNRIFKWSFWIILSCFLIGCAHSGGKEAENSTGGYTPDQLAKGTPVIELAEMGADFGAVKEDADLTHEFKFKNSGDGILLIKKVLPG